MDDSGTVLSSLSLKCCSSKRGEGELRKLGPSWLKTVSYTHLEQRVPVRFKDVNLKAFAMARAYMREHADQEA